MITTGARPVGVNSLANSLEHSPDYSRVTAMCGQTIAHLCAPAPTAHRATHRITHRRRAKEQQPRPLDGSVTCTPMHLRSSVSASLAASTGCRSRDPMPRTRRRGRVLGAAGCPDPSSARPPMVEDNRAQRGRQGNRNEVEGGRPTLGSHLWCICTSLQTERSWGRQGSSVRDCC